MKNKLSVYSILALVMALGVLAACTPGAGQGQIEPTVPAEGIVPDATQPADEAQPEIATLFVGPELVDCVGVAPQTCMQVKRAGEEAYTNFFGQIDGFTFEPGNEYELKVEITQVANPPADGSSLSYRLVEVVSQTPVAVGETTGLEGTRWQLVSYQDSTGNTVTAVPGVDAAITFADGNVGGTAGCNSFGGGYTVEGNTLTVGPLASTMMACLDNNIMEQEAAVQANLQAAATYTIEGDILTIANAEGETILTFQATEPIALTSVSWEATSYNNGNQAVVSLIAGTSITANFGEDGTLSGNAGCNQYTTSYTVDGEAITIQPAASTMMMCAEPEGVMEQETLYLQALTTAATYQVDGATLTLRTADGAMVANFTVAAAEGMNTNQAPEEILVALGNATYPLGDDGSSPDSVTLVNGEYRAPAAADSAQETVVALAGHSAVGQLEDGQTMAAVVLTSSSGGSGTFYYLAAATIENGAVTSVATTFLGDRVIINSVDVVDGMIVVDMVTQGPEDAFCCPTMPVVQSYHLVDGVLEPVQG